MPPVIAVDSHAHIFSKTHPFDENRNYTPDGSQIGSVERFLSVLDYHGLSHGLVVAAEPYGTDNSGMLAGIAASNGRLKGVALVSPSADDRELDKLAAGGVVGIRYNLSSFGLSQFEDPATTRMLERLKERGWFLQIHCMKDELAAVAPMLEKSGVRVIIDHFGRPSVRRGVGQPGFQALLSLGRTGNAVVKLSGPFRCSKEYPPYADVEPFIEAAVEAYTIDNCVWGSDWPFVKVEERIDYGPELSCVRRWFPDDADYDKVMRANPVRIFGFG